ncbi:MAG: hypothetical protein DRH44_03705 [Candidatus Coatesbacteria bacterium]|nr:MAG: hypothetical protein DRH44_03705 [Candidatus Coatesbacteria bacterium]
MRLPSGFISLITAVLITLAISVLDAFDIIRLKESFMWVKKPIQKTVIFVKQIRESNDETLDAAIFQHHIIANQKTTEILEVENRELKQLLGISLTLPCELKTAVVIDRVFFEGRVMELIIDKGSSSGIDKGLCAVSGYGLVGVVYDVSSTSSRIAVLGNPAFKVSVILPKVGEAGILEADREGNLNIKFVSTYADVNIGDLVYTSGEGGIFPRGILVGRISDVEQVSTEPFLRCTVLPSTDMKKVGFVSVCIR